MQYSVYALLRRYATGVLKEGWSSASVLGVGEALKFAISLAMMAAKEEGSEPGASSAAAAAAAAAALAAVSLALASASACCSAPVHGTRHAYGVVRSIE